MTGSNLSPHLPQRWRLSNVRSGREVVVAASPRVRYFDRYSGTDYRPYDGRPLPRIDRRSADDSGAEIGWS